MAASQFNRYIWLVDTIRSAGRISRQDIDRRWADSSLNDRKETCIPERTFHRYKDAIQELFDIEICCDRAAGGLYYIADDGNESRTKQWLRLLMVRCSDLRFLYGTAYARQQSGGAFTRLAAGGIP